MMKRYPGWNWSSIFPGAFFIGGAITLTGCFAIAFSGSRALAQNITLDGSVGPAGTLLGPNYVIPQAVGRTVGTNLFHSFGQFKLVNGEAAIFQSAGITNILSRVTGGSMSNIDGLIQSNSPANIFLINPNGIIFGQNARLDIGGSFVGTTANGIKFGEAVFPATASPVDPGNTLLLAVNPSALFFNQTPAGAIVNQSRVQNLTDLVRGNENGQQPGQGDAGSIFIDTSDTITIDGVGYMDGQPFASAIFSRVGRGAIGKAGNIQISTRSLSLSNLGRIDTSLGTTELGGDGTVGTAGSIFIEATDSVSLTSGATIRTVIEQGASESGGGYGFAGNIIPALLGKGGDVTGTILILTGKLSLEEGAVLNTSTFGNGNAGAVVVVADDDVSLKGGAIGSIVGEQAKGDAGAILMKVGSLSIVSTSDNIAGLTTETLGQGNAGLIYVEADNEVSLKGGGISSTVGEQAKGDAGAIVMKVGSLSIASTSDYDAGLTTETLGKGNAGLVYVEADKDISIRGGESGRESGIASRVSAGSTYDSGAIILNARSLFLRDEGAKVTVNNQGSGFAGGIEITMREDIILRDRGEISATAYSGKGAEIYLTSGDFLVLVSGSQVTAEAGQNTNFGDGGNVFVNARYVIAAPFNDNNIDANAFLGSGGKIQVNASRLYDIQKRNQASFQSNDITASSDFGLEGTVGISPLNADPTQGLANLPANPVDPTTLIAETCAPRGGITERQKNQFIVTGRGGLPPDPNAAFPGEAGVNDLGTPEEGEKNSTNDPSSTNPASPAQTVSPSPQKPKVDSPGSANPSSRAPNATASPQKPELVEAQGWVYGKNGDIIFTAQAPTITPNHPVLTPTSTCNAVSKSPQ